MQAINNMRQIAAMINLAGELQGLDSDHDGKPDIQEFIALGIKLGDEYNQMQATVGELQKLVGADVELIKQRLGI